jgi:HK97 family phage portal protein
MVSVGSSTSRSEDRLEMGLLSQLAELFIPPPAEEQMRVVNSEDFILANEASAIDDNYLNFVAMLTARRNGGSYRVPSVDEALGVPAVWAATTLIANTVGSLSMEAYRSGVLLEPKETPRLIQRPNPFTTPREFYRDTAYYLATRGEAWWWIPTRDTDGSALALYPIPPWEISVEPNGRNRLRPTIKWGKETVANEDLRHLTMIRGKDGRGVGPLQKCGSAVSVTVEAQDWAANFFSGNLPSIIGTTDQDLDEGELKLLDKQWAEKAGNLPRWMTQGMKIAPSPISPETAQLTEARNHQIGEAARMFSMPGALLEFQMGGSSITYQNQQDIWSDFQRRCLSPNYLEPIEQEMTDLLVRSTTARFNLKQLLRADAKTRFEVHKLAIEADIYDSETAAREEGYAPGSVDFAPVPFAVPQAVPALIPTMTRSEAPLQDLRCPKCGWLAGRVAGRAEIKCRRCGKIVEAA